eukprot:gene6804-7909_t
MNTGAYGYPGMNTGAYGYPAAPQPYPGYAAPMGYPPAVAAPAYPGFAPAAPYPSYSAAPMGVSVPIVTPMMAAVPVVANVNYVIHLKGCRLDRKDVFSKSDPFVTISVPRNPLYMGKGKAGKVDKKGGGSSAQWAVIHRTETHRDDQNPVFQPFTVALHTLCGGNLERPIKIECYDFDPNGAHDFIGSGVISVREMQIMKELRLVNKKRVGFTNTSGIIEILKCGPA